MQSRTAAFLACAEAADTEPILLVRAMLSGGTRYWTSRAGTYGGQVYTELLKNGLSFTIGLDPFGRTQRTSGQLVLANEDDGTGSRLSDMFATDTVQNRACEIDLLFYGLTHPTDSLRLFTGTLDVPTDNCFDDQVVTLNLLDDGNPTRDALLGLSHQRIHKILGTRINITDYPYADPDAVGQVQPLIYGTVPESPCQPVDAGALDVLGLDMGAGDTVLYLSDADAFALFPASGTVQIETEQITYTGKASAATLITTSSAGTTYTATRVTDASAWDLSAVLAGMYVVTTSGKVGTVTAKGVNYVDVSRWAGGTPTNSEVAKIYTGLALTGLTRGANATVAAAHVQGRQVMEVQATYTFLVAAHACKSVSNVRVNGVLQDPSVYTVSLAGPTTIVFTSRPQQLLAVSVTVQPGFTPTTIAEQSPGTISTTAEKSPGSISTTSEQGASTNTGSHGHTTSDSTTQFPSNGCPFSITTSRTITWPAAGSGGNYHCQVGLISGTWTLNGATLAIGDNYWSPGSAPSSESLSGSGDLIVNILERTTAVSATSSNDAAAGVSTTLTGATASSMGSLAGSTATQMSTLAGSTAISLSRTTNTVTSAADVLIGKNVTCDISGYADDGSGTYTGTPYVLITNPADQFRHLIVAILGLPAATWIDSATFTQARADYAGAGIRADWGLYAQLDSAELIERLRWSVASRLYLAATGKFKLFLLPPPSTPVKTYTEVDDVLGPDAGGHPISVGKTTLADLWNDVWLCYARNISAGDYSAYLETSDATSQTTYRTIGSLLIENDFVRDATAAAAIAAKVLAWHKDQQWRAQIPAVGTPSAHLEPLDPIAVTAARMPGGWTAKAFYVDQLTVQVGQPNAVDQVALTCREV